MANTVSHATRTRLQEEIERLVGLLDAGVPQSFTQAMQSFLAAMDYDDYTLMRSHLNAAGEAFQQVVYEALQKRLGWPQQARQACRKIRDLMTGSVCEDWDEVGKALESRFDETLKILTDLRDGSVKLLQKHGHEVENAAQLNQAIEELLELKQGVLGDWPWSDQELPPVDREMAVASRAAFKRGKGERIEDLIRRMGDGPAR
jgi:tryptophan 2,3-dioxygenase